MVDHTFEKFHSILYRIKGYYELSLLLQLLEGFDECNRNSQDT